MYLAENWKDYELLDTSDGERLERWGKYILIRPDPQVIWKGKKEHKLWKMADGIYRRSKNGGGAWIKNDVPEKWTIGYDGMTFNLKPMGFKHTGLFPEQAANWDWFSKLIKERKKQGKEVKVLNLFAYTGGATAACAKAGASVVHVDASKGMVQCAKENLMTSGLENAPVRYIVDDCRKFVEREIRRGNKYDGIIMDPPSYGRGPGGEVWKLEDAVCDFVSLCEKLISDDPLFMLINSYTTGLSALTMGYVLDIEIVKKHGGRAETAELALPVTQTKSFLPCGASARWVAEAK